MDKAKMKELREERGRAVQESRVLLEKAEGEGRDLTAEEEVQYTKIMEAVNSLRSRIDRGETDMLLDDELSKSVVEPNKPDPDKTDLGGDDKRKIPEMKYDARFCGMPLEIKAEGERATREYGDNFKRYLKEGLKSLNIDEVRALQADDDKGGGFLIAPQQFMLQLIQNVDDILHIRSKATVIPLTTSDSLGVPTLDTDLDDAEWTPEIGTAPEDTALQVGKRELEPFQLAKLVKVSRKLIRNSALPIDGIIRQRLAYKFALTEEKAYLTGTGAMEPLGVFTASDNGIPTSRDVNTDMASDDWTADGIRSIRGALKQVYRRNASWMLHRDGITRISKLKTGDSQYIWQPGLQAGDPDRLLGHPILESENVPNTYSNNLYVGLFGDLSWYWIAISLNLEVQILQELYAVTNQVGYIGRQEVDGMPVLAEAFVRAKLGA